MSEELSFEINDGELSKKDQIKKIFKNPLQHLRTGVSYMLPFILVGGLIGVLGSMTKFSDAAIWATIKSISQVGLKFYVPIFGTFIAYSIADKAAIAPAFICSYLANENGSGYLGALVAGFMVGYAVAVMKTAVKPPKIVEMLWGYLVPTIVCLVVALFIMLFLNGPVSAFANFMAAKLSGVEASKGALVGAVMGVFDGIDYGGPISKIASVIMYAGYDKGLYTLVGIRISYIMIPPLGIMMASFIAPKLFTKSERNYCKASLPIVFLGGYTELALPLVINDIIRCTIASFVGTVATGALAGYIGLSMEVPVFGLASWFFINNIPGYILCIVVGTAITAGTLILVRRVWPRKNFDPDAEDHALEI